MAEGSQVQSFTCKGAVATGLLREDVQITVEHNHNVSVQTAEAVKTKTTNMDNKKITNCDE